MDLFQNHHIILNMKQIKLNKNKDAQIGFVRVSQRLYDKIESVSKKHKVSMQTVVREVLENCIDDVEFK